MNVLLKVSELACGRDVADVTDLTWFVCLHSLLSTIPPTPWPVVKNTDFGVRSGWL